MYSVYFSSESGERASSRRSSCLRSSNRSVRKSFLSRINRSNAKKHGGFPRRNIRFLNCGLPRLSREQNFAVDDRFCVRQRQRLILLVQKTKRTDARCERATEHGH